MVWVGVMPMVTNIEVSRTFEPVPRMEVEARYVFTWMNDELDSVALEQRRVKDGVNTRFGKVEGVPLEDVPDDVVGQAKDKLRSHIQELGAANHGIKE